MHVITGNICPLVWTDLSVRTSKLGIPANVRLNTPAALILVSVGSSALWVYGRKDHRIRAWAQRGSTGGFLLEQGQSPSLAKHSYFIGIQLLRTEECLLLSCLAPPEYCRSARCLSSTSNDMMQKLAHGKQDWDLLHESITGTDSSSSWVRDRAVLCLCFQD